MCDTPRVPLSSRTSSSEPPPISARMPSAAGMPHSTPIAEYSASCCPDRMRIGTPGMRDCSRATKLRAVPRITHRRSRQHLERPRAHRACHRVIAVHHGERLGHALLVQPSGGLHPAAQPQHRLLVEDRHRVAAPPLVDDEADRVRSRSTTAQRGVSAGGLNGMRSVLVHPVRSPVIRQRRGDRLSVQRRAAAGE